VNKRINRQFIDFLLEKWRLQTPAKVHLAEGPGGEIYPLVTEFLDQRMDADPAAATEQKPAAWLEGLSSGPRCDRRVITRASVHAVTRHCHYQIEPGANFPVFQSSLACSIRSGNVADSHTLGNNPRRLDSNHD
jgi:hypothetical protein